MEWNRATRNESAAFARARAPLLISNSSVRVNSRVHATQARPILMQLLSFLTYKRATLCTEIAI